MRYVRNALWKQAATSDEKREIARLDKELAKLRERAKKLAVERNAIANRATVRARYRAVEPEAA